MNRSKLSALLSLVLVFLSGGVLGAVAYRLYSASPVIPGAPSNTPPPRKSPEEMRKKYIADLSKDVKLDPDQVQKLSAILDQTHSEFDKLNEKSKSERDALNAQRQAFEDKWRPEREAIHDHQVDAINALLREDQKPLYSAFR